jgi:HAD superfamily hydrolase (TIGR01450 family)
VFDLDGCVYAGNTLLPGVAAVLARLRSQGRAVSFLTNNSRQSSEELLGKLTRLGIPAAAGEILSGAGAAAPYLLERFGPRRVLTTGSETLQRLLSAAGHTLVPLDAYREAQVVLVGHDFDFDYRRLTALSRAVAAGAAFVAVNLDARLPVEEGEFYPGCAALVEAVASAAGARPQVIGKPEPYLFEMSLSRLGLSPAEAAMVGDSPRSDILGASRAGLRTIWLAPPGLPTGEVRADLRIHDFAELLARL